MMYTAGDNEEGGSSFKCPGCGCKIRCSAEEQSGGDPQAEAEAEVRKKLDEYGEEE
jgi:hypothetical protein